jgi:hypothetical protein
MTSPTTTAPNPLVAPRQDTTQWYTGIYIAEDIAFLRHGIEDGSWVESGLGALATGLDGLVLVLDPLGSLASYGIAWLMERVRPLREALDKLAGDPAQIAAHATTWKNLAGSVEQARRQLDEAVATDIADWSGPAGDAYRNHAGAHGKVLQAAGEGALALSSAVEKAGTLVAMVRMIVRNLIADFVSVLVVRLAVWAAEELFTVGWATPYVIAQVSALVSEWVAKISNFIAKLVRSMKALGGLMARLEQLIMSAKDVLTRLVRPTAHPTIGIHDAPVTPHEPVPHEPTPHTTAPHEPTPPHDPTPPDPVPHVEQPHPNSAGDPYPQVIDPRTGEPVHYPGQDLEVVPREQRVTWGRQERGEYIADWYRHGYETPPGGWARYDIHHIQPREYGGTNAFENLVPVLRDVHQNQFNPWWRNY